jgi:hypothetical protein
MRPSTWRTGRPVAAASSAVAPSRRRRQVRVAGLVSGALLALAACAPNLPAPDPDPVPAVPPPVLSVAQSTSVLGKIGAVLANADANLSVAGLPARLSGPALAIRSAEYAIALGTAGGRAPTQLPMTAQSFITPRTDTWPRYELVVTEQPDNLQSPRLLVLEQKDPRDPYMLWGWTRLLASVEMPAMADPAIGSTPLAPDAKSLLVAPQDVIAEYVDVLTHGDASPSATAFAPDEYRAGLASSLALLQQGLKQVGTVADAYTVAPNQLIAMSTADGGALVVAGISTVTTATVTVAGGAFSLRPTEASLAGVGEVKSLETITWADLVAFYIPPAGATTPVRVLAAEHQRVAVTAQ